MHLLFSVLRDFFSRYPEITLGLNRIQAIKRLKLNASTGEEYCEWFVCGVCGVCGIEIAFKIKQAKELQQVTAGWLHSFLSFFPEISKLQLAVYSEWK